MKEISSYAEVGVQSVISVSATSGNGADNTGASPGKGIQCLETSVCMGERMTI